VPDEEHAVANIPSVTSAAPTFTCLRMAQSWRTQRARAATRPTHGHLREILANAWAGNATSLAFGVPNNTTLFVTPNALETFRNA